MVLFNHNGEKTAVFSGNFFKKDFAQTCRNVYRTQIKRSPFGPRFFLSNSLATIVRYRRSLSVVSGQFSLPHNLVLLGSVRGRSISGLPVPALFLQLHFFRCDFRAVHPFCPVYFLRIRSVLWPALAGSLFSGPAQHRTFVFEHLLGIRSPYNVCSFVFLFPLFPTSVSVLRVCLPHSADTPASAF